MKTTKPPQTHALELGLEALKLSSKEEQQQHQRMDCSTCTIGSNMLSPNSSSSLMGDHIGMESCVDLENNEEVNRTGKNDERDVNDERRGKRDQRWEMKKKKKKKEFPPPIPLLARTGNLPSHMPWILRRYYTSDGRLIMKEEKVRHHEYFRAHRANGRLTLHLVPLDDDVLDPPVVGGDSEDIGAEDGDAEDEGNDDHVKEDGGDDDDSNDVTLLEESMMKLASSVPESSSSENGTSTGIGGSKCFNYNSRRSSSSNSCIFDIPVPAIRPVHS